jgi:biopolymer transport protein ExbB/TolQ
MKEITIILYIVGLIIWVIAWAFLPFAVFGIKRRLDVIIKLLEESNKLDEDRDIKPKSLSKFTKPKDIEDMSIREISKKIQNGTIKGEENQEKKG